jgi:hypothetical protein
MRPRVTITTKNGSGHHCHSPLARGGRFATSYGIRSRQSHPGREQKSLEAELAPTQGCSMTTRLFYVPAVAHFNEFKI